MTAPYQMVSFTFAEMAQVKREMLHHASYAERTSFALVCRLASLRSVIADYEVLDEIAALEGGGRISNTKKDEAFKGKVLQGFRHKHFSTPRHTWRNVGDAWGLNIPADQRDQTKKFAAFNDLINECSVKHRGDARSALMEATFRFVIDGLQKRSAAREMTGDWIIFARHEQRNYYLDIASHEEGNNEEKLFRKLRDGCATEFPFLFPKRDSSTLAHAEDSGEAAEP